MKRIIDGALPGCAAIATVPLAAHLIPLPPSMVAFVGDPIAWAWAVTMALSFTSITIGVAVSKQHPKHAFALQAIPLSYIGVVFLVHVVALFAINGWTAWAAGWWEIGLIIYFFARTVEVWKALQTAKRLERERLIGLAGT